VWHVSHVVCASSLLRDDPSEVVLGFVSAAQHSIATLHAVPELERCSSGTACKVAMLCWIHAMNIIASGML